MINLNALPLAGDRASLLEVLALLGVLSDRSERRCLHDNFADDPGPGGELGPGVGGTLPSMPAQVGELSSHFPCGRCVHRCR